MVLDLFRKKKPAKEDEAARRRNADILDLALAQRSKVHVQFDEADSGLTGVTATIMAVGEAGVILELGGVAALKDRFIGKSVTCFFRIVEREDRHREIFYNFTAPILRIRQLPDRPPQAALAFPTALNGAQRRKSLRMRPDFNQFSHIALWKYEASGGFDMAKPTVAHGHFKTGLALIENISAGGLRFRLKRQHVKEQGLDPKKGDRFIIFFTFNEKVPKLREEYWLVAKVNNIQPEPVSGELSLGLEFVANGVRQESGKVEWSKIEDNVIDDMAQRIYLWHVSLYRDRGLS
ncbi:PilZ domain-containing protein [Solidesulfovibrio carbinolicus]|uniref:Pilus assembly protein PilZ n=1 Tax=Solidesulfovibrio carbinolicus TaxID=296842 RepID=A0A4P6HG45_9BACT|nr:PilZ domain-containing protein [Solidesulfovibrio carbinolicus]QAZ65715.1 pilus assembly protein PilZ [Solidesulfovibrio carbinolicus]